MGREDNQNEIAEMAQKADQETNKVCVTSPGSSRVAERQKRHGGAVDSKDKMGEIRMESREAEICEIISHQK